MPEKVYSDEFRRGAVEQVIVQRHTIGSVAKRLGVNYHTLREWVVVARSTSPASPVPADHPLEQRIRELEKECARLRMERAILKKATAYFAKEQL